MAALPTASPLKLLHQQRDHRQHDADAEDIDDHGPEQDHDAGALAHRDDAASVPERTSRRKSPGPSRPPPPDCPDFPAHCRIIDSRSCVAGRFRHDCGRLGKRHGCRTPGERMANRGAEVKRAIGSRQSIECRMPIAECRLPIRYSPFTPHAAPRIRRSAAARASSVTTAPASMRAISSRRRTESSGVMLVVTALPPAIVCLATRRWMSARAATCGAWVTVMHLHACRQPRQPHADGVGDGAADGGVDLVEDEGRRRAAIGQRHLQRQQEARQLAARGDLHQRSGLGAGIGAHMEGDIVDARFGGRVRVAGDLDDEGRLLQLERRQFGGDRLFQQLGGGAALLRQDHGRGVVFGAGGLRRLLQLSQPLLAGFERGEVGGHAARQAPAGRRP